MTLTAAHTHEELLTLARKVQAAAEDGDRDRLEGASLKLYDALLAHVGAERPDLRRLPPPELRVLARGQRRVLDELAELASRAHMIGACHCATRAADLVARLFLQAADERRALTHV
jgi:hypothetical protein